MSACGSSAFRAYDAAQRHVGLQVPTMCAPRGATAPGRKPEDTTEWMFRGALVFGIALGKSSSPPDGGGGGDLGGGGGEGPPPAE